MASRRASSSLGKKFETDREASERERLAARSLVRPNWYGTAKWQALRLKRLEFDLWTCQQTGVGLIGVYPAWNSAAVDHIDPHNWDEELFWDFDNLQSVTKQWHDAAKQTIERRARG